MLPLALVAGMTLAGCGKENTTTNENLTGRLTLSFPGFVNPGYTKEFLIDTLTTLTRSDGGPIGYRIANSGTGENDTLVTASGAVLRRHFTVTIPDEIASFSATLYAFVESSAPYYGTSASVPYSVVRPGLTGDGSITNFKVSSDETFTDPRNGQAYYLTQAGGKTWMRSNLAWAGAGRPYQSCVAMSDIFGQYYTWEEAQTACPEGWRLPTDAEWTALSEDAQPEGKDIPSLAGKVMADLYFNGNKMWEYWREVPITDQLGLSAMPVGYANIIDGSYTFDGLYKYAAFWTSDESGGMGVFRYIYHSKNVVYRGRISKTDFAASVRCVKQ